MFTVMPQRQSSGASCMKMSDPVSGFASVELEEKGHLTAPKQRGKVAFLYKKCGYIQFSLR